METTTDRILARVRRYFADNPKLLKDACTQVGLSHTTAIDALKEGRSPRSDTLSKLERAVPAEYEPESANG
jgi:hypothetical protein